MGSSQETRIGQYLRAAGISGLVAKGARLRTVLSLVLVFPLLAQSALAQIGLVASNPQMGAVIRRHDIMFSLRFNKRIGNTQCSISLKMPNGEQRALSLQAQTASDEIEASGINLGIGPYVLSWQIKTPGDPVMTGTVSFSVR
jgi:methionine-rich copper-binding protein CopC